VPDIIHDCDYYTQAMFNRCIVQIGITSFFYGKYHETQQFLSEICGYGKNRDQTKDIIKEFLAQGHSRTQNDREIPKNKILPYYLHLNVELIESLELIASMVLEVPYTLTEGGRISSRTFKKVYFEYERSVIS
jgi:translation initiation factor 3 subunit C